MRRALATSVFVGVILAALLIVLRGWEFGYSAKSIGYLAVAGMVLGAIAAPEVEPQAFRYRALWQMFFAVLGCVLIAYAWEAPPEGYALAVVGGAIAGYAAPVWIKHINP